MAKKSLKQHLAKLATTDIEAILEIGKDNPGDLHKVVSDSEVAINKVTKETQETPAYQEAQRVVSDFKAALRAAIDRQKAKQYLALILLDEENISSDEDEVLEEARRKVYEDQKARNKAS